MKKKVIKTTPFGPVCILWSEVDSITKIARIIISTPGLSAIDQAAKLYRDLQEGSCTEIDTVATGIKSFLDGENITFFLDITDLGLCSCFQRSVLCADHRIQRGDISTYSQIATSLGIEKGARAVGNALAKNPFPIIMPCHRVIRSDRHLGGYRGGLYMKRTLLEKEGVVFDKAGRVTQLSL